MEPHAYYLLLGVPVVGNSTQIAKFPTARARDCESLRTAIPRKRGLRRMPDLHSGGASYPAEAASPAAAGPSESSTRRPASSRTGTPSDAALSSFEPGLSPATTKLVFFDTEPDTFPPRA